MSISIDSNVEFDVLIGFTHRFLLFYLRGVISLFFFLVSPSNLVIGISFKDTYLSLTQRGKSLTLSLIPEEQYTSYIAPISYVELFNFLCFAIFGSREKGWFN